jgi:antitoxin MazE
MPRSQIVKWGNSLAVRIPKHVAEEAGVAEGDPIVIDATEGRIQVRRRRRKPPSLEELVAQITAQNRYEETETGSEQGQEIVEW